MTAVAEPPQSRRWTIRRDVAADLGVELSEVGDVGQVVGLVFDGPPTPTPACGQRALSPRLLEVLSLVADGLTNREIGQRLGVSDDTIKTHLRRLFQQVGAVDRAHAVAIGFRAGWLL